MFLRKYCKYKDNARAEPVCINQKHVPYKIFCKLCCKNAY